MKDAAIDAPPDAPGPCNVLTQTGCAANQRCTYLNEGSALGEMCESMGTAGHGSNCSIDQSSGIDNCMAGDVCAGGCKTVCNTQGSDTCGSGYVCNSYQHGNGTVGACDRTCDPLNDNDFDGPATAHSKSGTVCTIASQGCYGSPVNSGSNHTVFTCASDINYSAQNLHNKDGCTAANSCAQSSGSPYINGCNQGYEPLLHDSTGTTTVLCAALCKPINCFSGNCGNPPGSIQTGVFPHRCDASDALGSFNATVAGEQCTYWWFLEVDQGGGSIHRSPYSDTLGVCLDHSMFKYDSNGDGMVNQNDMNLPACSTLASGTGTGVNPNPFGAADLGCQDSSFTGLPRHIPPSLKDLRLPYHRAP